MNAKLSLKSQAELRQWELLCSLSVQEFHVSLLTEKNVSE